ncbi:MAG: serine/threonine-protein kinase [Myxococcota bacterium]|jgi:serine/threonine protein kinase|nr:serine/threonine-protein kinase [Myxococcota bacterium]
MDHSQDQEKELSDGLIGRVLEGRYEIQELIGEGAMGAVYRGEHTRMRKTVAVKVLHASLTQSDELTERFRREAEAIAKIDHPNVCQAYDSGVAEDGAYYLVMEYLDGMSLADLLHHYRRLPIALGLHIFKQVLAALGRAHAVGIVHRDLKPDNIFLITKDEDPYFVKLVDFGIASLGDAPTAQNLGEQAKVPIDKRTRLTKAGMVYGTPQYLSPEQAVGAPIDHRSDLYAAGIVLYEMLCGQPPFDSENIVQVISMHVTRPVPALADVCPEARVPPGLEALLMSLLAKPANERPASANETLGRIEALQLDLDSPSQSLPVVANDIDAPPATAPTLAPGDVETANLASLSQPDTGDTAPSPAAPSTADEPVSTERLLIAVSDRVEVAKLRRSPAEQLLRTLSSSPIYLALGAILLILFGILALILFSGDPKEQAPANKHEEAREEAVTPEDTEDQVELNEDDNQSLSTLRQSPDTTPSESTEVTPFAELPIAAELRTLVEVDPKLALEQLAPLRNDYPSDEDYLLLLCLAESRSGEWTLALESVRRLLARNEDWIHDERIFGLLIEAIGRKAESTASSASRILSWHLGDEKVVDKLVQEAILGEIGSNMNTRKRIHQLLSENAKLELLASWARAALELRLADKSSCQNRLKLVNTLIALDDVRAIPVLEIYDAAPTDACGGFRKKEDCHGCMRTHVAAGLTKLRTLQLQAPP